MNQAPATTRVYLLVFALIAAVLMPLTAQPSPAEALSGSDFDPGNIISDANFYNGSAMSEAEIQRFLENAVGGTCSNSNCLAVYRADTPTRTWSFGTCSTYVGGAGESAARIIFKVQQACNLSAKVILVTLQKEQSLVTDRAPTDSVMRKAMGYGCPDTSSCDSTYYGFFNQLFAAGRQLTWYGNPEGSFTSIRVGQVNAIRYHPNAACGTKDVLVQNRATAALYYYTPYTPNAAALANLGGIGDGCSAYGNRNFWVFYNNWFGSPTGGRAPIGNVEVWSASPGSVRVTGWALDPDTTASIPVHIYVGPAGTAFTASGNRPDVGAAYGLGANHGFDAVVKVTSSGPQDVCVYAINSGPGGNTLLQCKRLDLMGGSPLGALDSVVAGSGQITATGWALDPDQPGPIQVHVYVGSVSTAFAANGTYAGLNARYPGYGDNHGYKATAQAAPGTHNVCVYAINVGTGAHVQLGCQTVTVLGESGRVPVGNAETIAVEGTGIRVGGWALDPDTAQSIPVHVYVGSAGYAYAADDERADVGRLYPANGSKHGFSELVPASPGTNSVCVYAINTGPGGHTLLRCATVTIGSPIQDLGRSPIGNLESVRVEGGEILFSGWALDPDTASSIPVHLYVDSAGTALPADAERTDIANAYPGYGSAHGFSGRISAAAGGHTVCAYAINNGQGGHTQLGCRQVTIASTMPDLGRAPIGNLEVVSAGAGSVSVGGWALDPDTSASIPVHVYVDGAGMAITANGDRPDIAGAYPAYGPAHGFGHTMSAPSGQRNVCVYGINNGAGGHSLLGCRTIQVP